MKTRAAAESSFFLKLAGDISRYWDTLERAFDDARTQSLLYRVLRGLAGRMRVIISESRIARAIRVSAERICALRAPENAGLTGCIGKAQKKIAPGGGSPLLKYVRDGFKGRPVAASAAIVVFAAVVTGTAIDLAMHTYDWRSWDFCAHAVVVLVSLFVIGTRTGLKEAAASSRLAGLIYPKRGCKFSKVP
jgi:hypothetical protein